MAKQKVKKVEDDSTQVEEMEKEELSVASDDVDTNAPTDNTTEQMEKPTSTLPKINIKFPRN